MYRPNPTARSRGRPSGSGPVGVAVRRPCRRRRPRSLVWSRHVSQALSLRREARRATRRGTRDTTALSPPTRATRRRSASPTGRPRRSGSTTHEGRGHRHRTAVVPSAVRRAGPRSASIFRLWRSASRRLRRRSPVRAAPHAISDVSDVNGRTPYPGRTATSPNPLNLQIESPSTTEGKGDHRDPRIYVCRLKLMHAALSSLAAPHRRFLDEKVFAGRGGVNHLPPLLVWGRRGERASRPTAVGCSRRALRARRGGAKDLRRA